MTDSVSHDLAQALYVAGTVPFILLGLVHGIYTWVERSRPFRLAPRRDDLRGMMQETGMKIHPSTNLWRAWIGFNFTHSLGLLIFGVVYLELSMHDFGVIAGNSLLLGLPVVIAAVYVALSWRYFFIYPLIGTAMGLASFIAGWVAV